jgi:TPR repeat protein
MTLSPLQCGPPIRTLREADIEMTRLYLRSSVAAGQPWARGDGVEKRLLQAAEGGDARAQCNLGILYGNGLDDNGHVVEANRTQAVRWLLAAAEQGLAPAQLKLAEAYAEEPDMSGSTRPRADGSCRRLGACTAFIGTELDLYTSASSHV